MLFFCNASRRRSKHNAFRLLRFRAKSWSFCFGGVPYHADLLACRLPCIGKRGDQFGILSSVYRTPCRKDAYAPIASRPNVGRLHLSSLSRAGGLRPDLYPASRHRPYLPYLRPALTFAMIHCSEHQQRCGTPLSRANGMFIISNWSYRRRTEFQSDFRGPRLGQQ